MKLFKIHCFMLLTFITTVCACNSSGSSGAFSDEPVIEPELSLVYPDKTDDVFVNSSIIIGCNKPINEDAFEENMVRVYSDNKTLAGTATVSNDTIVFVPLDGVVMDADTGYTVEASGMIDCDGIAVKNMFSWSFMTGDAHDYENPYVENIKCKTGKIEVFFNEPLYPFGIQDDAVELIDTSTGEVITGTVEYYEFENKITFFPNTVLNEDIKYFITILEDKGIKDTAFNDFIPGTSYYEFFPSPVRDTERPFITLVETQNRDQSLTIYFSEKINYFNLLKPEYNYIYKTRVYTTMPNSPLVPVYVVNGIIADGSSLVMKEFYRLVIQVNEQHNSITISFPYDDLIPGRNIIFEIDRSAYVDLFGNRLYHRYNVDDDDCAKIEINWIIPDDGIL